MSKIYSDVFQVVLAKNILDLFYACEHEPDIIKYNYENKGNFHQLCFYGKDEVNLMKFRITDEMYKEIMQLKETSATIESTPVVLSNGEQLHVLSEQDDLPIGCKQMPVGFYDE